MWFRDIMGFFEESPDQVRQLVSFEDGRLRSSKNGAEYQVGEFEMPSLAELRERTASLVGGGKVSVSELVGDVKKFHQLKENQGALFQVASQFNLLEMISPGVTPERGVGIYEQDGTQGPACAIACGAGTIFRNYFIPVGEQIGQSATCQIDCLSDLGQALGNGAGKLWSMQNGYALSSEAGLLQVSEQLGSATPVEIETLGGLLRVGFHHQTQVTINECQHSVAQVYGSALPVAYSGLPSRMWEPFARLVLEASYEATLRAALINRHQTGNQKVFLTLLGGGAFGNQTDWILTAIRGAISMFQETDLDIRIVSYGSSRAEVANLAAEFT